jgi:hypothetical protein
MKTLTQTLKRNVYGVAAIMLTAAVTVPNLLVGQVYAAQLLDRSIQMSSSQFSATGVQYQVNFTTSAAMQSLVIDFCSNTPLAGASCTAPTNLNVSSAATSSGTWSVGTGSTSQIRLTNSGSQSAGPQSITVTGLVNPSTVDTFYARIYTFANASYGTYSNAASPGNYVDNGSVALSTTENIEISAAVLETLTFCVSKAAPTSGCGGTTSPSLSLGTGTPAALSTSLIDSDTGYFQLSTNASGDTFVRLAGTTLTSGSNDINPIGGATFQTITAGTENFGLSLGAPVGVSPSAGTVSAVAPYNGNAASDQYGFDDTAVGGTYGDVIASANGPVGNMNVPLIFAATIGNTTPAGLYTTSLNLIATSAY